MNFAYDILIPFVIGLIGIYLAYIIFDLFLKISFQITAFIKEELNKRKTISGKILTIGIALVMLVVIGLSVVRYVLGDESETINTIIRTVFCLLGFAIFIVLFNSPLHEKYKD